MDTFDRYMTIPSPCVSLCQMDDDSTLCQGCWRTIDEIIAWSSLDDEEKKQVWTLIESRKNLIEIDIKLTNQKKQ